MCNKTVRGWRDGTECRDLRVEMAALAEEQGSIPSTGTQPSVTSAPGDLMPFYDLHGHQHTHGAHTCIHVKHP